MAHHWHRLLEEGRCAGLRKIAEVEGMDLGRASRIFRLTQLAPAVIETALRDGRLAVGLSELLGWFPERWPAQLGQLARDAGGGQVCKRIPDHVASQLNGANTPRASAGSGSRS